MPGPAGGCEHSWGPGRTVALASGVWSWLARRGANPLLGVLLAALALVTLVALALPLSRGARSDRVDLSPEEVTTEHLGRRVRVTWDDVRGCVPMDGRPLALVLEDDARPTVDSRGWPLWRQPSALEFVEPVVVGDLPVRPDLLARVVALCADDPALRASLGTEASLDWLSFPPVRGGSGTGRLSRRQPPGVRTSTASCSITRRLARSNDTG